MTYDRNDDHYDETSVAAVMFESLLWQAVRKLPESETPVVIASCPNKYNDICNIPNWMGVQIGTTFWENDTYGLRRSKNADGVPPGRLADAKAVLDNLEKEGWRSHFDDACSAALGPETVIGIVVQGGARWLVASASNNGEDLAYLILDKGRLLFAGWPRRLDERLGEERPLEFEKIERASIEAIRQAAPEGMIMPDEKPDTWEHHTHEERFGTDEPS